MIHFMQPFSTQVRKEPRSVLLLRDTGSLSQGARPVGLTGFPAFTVVGTSFKLDCLAKLQK